MWQQIELALSQSAQQVLVKLASFLPGLLALLLAVVILSRHRLPASPRSCAALSSPQSSTSASPRNAIHHHLRVVALSQPHPAPRPRRLLGLRPHRLSSSASPPSTPAYSGDSPISVFLLPYLTHSIGAILLLLAGTLIARFLARSVLIGAVNAKLQYARFLSLGIKWLVLVLTAAMVLDHLQIGGAVVELAFGILFGGIVLTLSLAIGLGSRDIVSRSIERSADHRSTLDPIPGDPDYKASASESLRHF